MTFSPLPNSSNLVLIMIKEIVLFSILSTLNSLFSLPLHAADSSLFSNSLDYAQVNYVTAKQSKDGSWCFNTQIRHNDQGWEHYADGWQVHDLEGNLLAERRLLHPHDNEQPFTRGQCDIQIPKALTHVIVTAKCNQHGTGGRPVKLDMNKKKGEGFSLTPYPL